MEELEQSTPRQLDQLRKTMAGHVSEKLSAAAAEYRELRVIGTFAVAVRLICATLANFV